MNALFGALPRACLRVSVFAATVALFSGAPARGAGAAAPAPVTGYADVLRSFNARLSPAQSTDMAAHVLLLSSYYGLDPRLLVAIVGVESSWRSGAVSSAGAQGLGQLMPATAGGLGVLTFDAYENLDGTARYLRRMMQLYPGLSADARLTRAIASYNAGPQAVARAGGVPPFAETRAYVDRVLALWHRLQLRLPGLALSPPPALARAPARAPARPPARPRPHAPLLPAPPDSVADFTTLDLQSVQAVELAAAEQRKTPEPRGFHRWLMRAFGPPRPAGQTRL